jgi:hypothetical protein
MNNIKVRKSSCNRLMSSKEYYLKQQAYYQKYQKEYYKNNKEKLPKITDSERKRIYSRNYIREKCNYKSVKVLDERFNTNLDIDSYNNFQEFITELNL